MQDLQGGPVACASTQGFWQALRDLRIDRAFGVAPVLRGPTLTEGVEALPMGGIGAIFDGWR